MPQPDIAQDDELVMNLVDLALAQPAGEREAYLHNACAEDPKLFERVWDYVQREERMGEFLRESIYSLELFDVAFEPGQLLLDGRFRIERKVGEGGMGIVYEAWDATLDQRVALKFAKTGFRKRLPPEVRHAREIAHDNVCKIFEIHTAPTDRGEIDFIVMEFLEGETLTERLNKGALPKKEARAIARQLAAGLAAAHRHRVIHGDLKSNNVILTKSADGGPRAVITDFGLARGVEGVQAIVKSGGLAVSGGTPDYMAPELWKGHKVSAATDIYALGVILYEMLTGTRLQSPDIPWDKRLRLKPPKVNVWWDGILLRCVNPDPARRYRSAAEIEKALAPRWSLALATAAAVVLAAGTGVAAYRTSMVSPQPVRLAMLPFETTGMDKSLGDGLLGQTAERLRRVKSSRTRRLTVIPLDAVLRNKLDKPEKAVQLLGATHVLYGTLRREDGKAYLHAYLTDARSRIPLKEWQADYQPEDLRNVPVALAGMITGTFRLPALAVSATVNSAAYGDFTQGIGLMERNGVDQAIPLLENAVRLDPTSPLTHARLAESQILKYWSTDDPMWMEQAILSLGDANRRNPDVAAVWSVSGLIDYYRGLYEVAEADLRRALEMEPQNGDAWRRLGMVYQKNSRFGDAQEAYRQAIQTQPGYFLNHQDLCDLLDEEAQYEEAIGQCTRMVELAPDLSESYYARAIPYFNWGRYPDAENDLRAALRLEPNSSKALQLMASSLAYEGRYREALSLFQRSLEIGPETHQLYMNLGETFLWAGSESDARAAYRKGVAMAKEELARNSRDRTVQAHLAYLWARLNEHTKAETEAVLALQTAPVSEETARYAVMTYEALGERDRALALAQGAPDDVLKHLIRAPNMAALCNSPRFQQLMESRHIQQKEKMQNGGDHVRVPL
jgi:eukaryotic-like serine/threonine-protein kinase